MYLHAWRKKKEFPCVNFTRYHNEFNVFVKRLQHPEGQKVTGTMTNVGHLIQCET